MPCAGVPGTQITVEDVFYNMPTRLKAFRNPSEEYNRIVDVVTRYAVHCGDRSIALTCRKYGSASPDVHAAPATDRRAVVRQLFGAALVKELLDVSGGPGLAPPSLPAAAAGIGKEPGSDAPASTTAPHASQDSSVASLSSSAVPEGPAVFEFKGLVSNANYSLRRRMFMLFINGR